MLWPSEDEFLKMKTFYVSSSYATVIFIASNYTSGTTKGMSPCPCGTLWSSSCKCVLLPPTLGLRVIWAKQLHPGLKMCVFFSPPDQMNNCHLQQVVNNLIDPRVVRSTFALTCRDMDPCGPVLFCGSSMSQYFSPWTFDVAIALECPQRV